MPQLISNTSLVGQSHCLNVDEFAFVDFSMVGKTHCHFELLHAGKTYTGGVALSEDQLTLTLVFDQADVALPRGVCFEITCDTCRETGESACPNDHIEITEATRIAVLKDDGCPQGYMTVSDLKTAIIGSLSFEDVKFNFCQLFPDGIPEGDLVASDKLLTLNTAGTSCSIKAINPTDISCEK